MTRTNRLSIKWKICVLILSFGLLSVAGCRKTSEAPTTHPASGKVVYADGQPMQGGSIDFSPVPPDSSLTITGAIDGNGGFTLSTIKRNDKVPGAVEGQYRVTIFPAQTPDHRPVSPIALPGTYTVKPGENVFPPFTAPRSPSTQVSGTH